MTLQAQEKAQRDVRRMGGTFGWFEMERAALRILDAQWERPWDPVDTSKFDRDELDGFMALQRNGWIDRRRVPTRAFWLRVHGR